MSLDFTDCNDESRMQEFTDEIPSDYAFLENNDIRIDLNPKDGSIGTITQKHEDIKVELRQRFLAYDGKVQTNSGLYIFNPQHDAQDFKYDMKRVKTVVQDGEIMRCVETFQKVAKYRDLLFSNRVCLENGGETAMFYKQQVRAHSSNYNEIVMRTEVLSVNKQGVLAKFEEGGALDIEGYYTDDSMKEVKRKVYS